MDGSQEALKMGGEDGFGLFDVVGRTTVHDGEKAAASEIARNFEHAKSFLDPCVEPDPLFIAHDKCAG